MLTAREANNLTLFSVSVKRQQAWDYLSRQIEARAKAGFFDFVYTSTDKTNAIEDSLDKVRSLGYTCDYEYKNGSHVYKLGWK